MPKADVGRKSGTDVDPGRFGRPDGYGALEGGLAGLGFRLSRDGSGMSREGDATSGTGGIGGAVGLAFPYCALILFNATLS